MQISLDWLHCSQPCLINCITLLWTRSSCIQIDRTRPWLHTLTTFYSLHTRKMGRQRCMSSIFSWWQQVKTEFFCAARPCIVDQTYLEDEISIFHWHVESYLPSEPGKYVVKYIFFSVALWPQRGPWPPHSWGFLMTHNDAPQSVGLLWTSAQLITQTSTWQHTTFTTGKHPCPWRDSNTQSQQVSGRRPTP